ncbi:RluA family pseudouridine synthase [Bacteriovorax sp. Seq25_V]|uniref:RluA family pseudouridine synthase n=1 Tax=Bacteriovorax sp. Seq25_V TaxID=1201288 RepID=UPI000389FEE8|nr:pseudouridine synthase [Bacteriovorax sp. Seq25_V]EQC45446.1 pseudouridine synthase, RluA family [Bacteriovorax sp. Seq25_V]
MAKKKLDILYWDKHYIAVAKPAGILVHPFKSQDKDRRHLMRSLKKQTDLYLYPIHRLDKPVSGVVIFGLSKEATRLIKEQWSTDLVEKKYITMCKGVIDEEGEFNFPLKAENGAVQEAKTIYKRLKENGEYSLADVSIKTGRMHQIRRHFSRRMFNLVGDTKYGKAIYNNYYRQKFNFYRLFLHSYELSFHHPIEEKWVKISCPLPEELTEIISSEFN